MPHLLKTWFWTSSTIFFPLIVSKLALTQGRMKTAYPCNQRAHQHLHLPLHLHHPSTMWKHGNKRNDSLAIKVLSVNAGGATSGEQQMRRRSIGFMASAGLRTQWRGNYFRWLTGCHVIIFDILGVGFRKGWVHFVKTAHSQEEITQCRISPLPTLQF